MLIDGVHKYTADVNHCFVHIPVLEISCQTLTLELFSCAGPPTHNLCEHVKRPYDFSDLNYSRDRVPTKLRN